MRLVMQIQWPHTLTVLVVCNQLLAPQRLALHTPRDPQRMRPIYEVAVRRFSTVSQIPPRNSARPVPTAWESPATPVLSPAFDVLHQATARAGRSVADAEIAISSPRAAVASGLAPSPAGMPPGPRRRARRDDRRTPAPG